MSISDPGPCYVTPDSGTAFRLMLDDLDSREYDPCMFKVAVFRVLLLVLVPLSAGCVLDVSPPALSAPTPTITPESLTVPQATVRGDQISAPNTAPTPVAQTVSQAKGQENERETFTADVGETVHSDSGNAIAASLSDKVRQVIPAVVRISTNAGSGSGIIVQGQSNVGYVVTNHHVVQGATRVQVTIGDSATYQAELLGGDATRDLAVLKICCGGFPVAQFGDVANLEPGTDLLIVGYPHGMSGPATITKGIVSAIRFSTTLQSRVIQTDAATNPGNSGGPLVSLGGEVLGIVTFKYADAEGLGFAVPSDVVIQQLPSLWASEQAPPPVPSLVPITTPGSDGELEARIQEAIQELMPTPTPSPVPTIRAMPSSVPEATVGALPTPLPPTPTLHPCDLVAMASLAALESEYHRFMDVDPYTNSVNHEFRGVLARLFPKIAASYTLEFIDDPLKYASFRDYLEKVGYQAASSNIGTELKKLRHNGEWQIARLATGCDWARLQVFNSDNFMTLLAVEIAKEGVAPFMNDAATRITVQDINRYRDDNPTAPLIGFVLEMVGER